MDIKYINEDDFELWESVVSNLSIRTFNYNYQKHIFNKSYSDNFVDSVAFYIVYENKVSGFMPVYIELVEGKKQISLFGGYNPSPLIDISLPYSKQEKIMRRMFNELDKIAEENTCCKIKINIDPLINPSFKNSIYNHNFLIEFGFMDESTLSRVIDLNIDEKLFDSEIRSNYQRDIKKGLGLFDVVIVDKCNITKDIMNEFKTNYNKAAGFETKSMNHSDNYYDWVSNGNAVIASARKGDEVFAQVMYIIDNNRAYYGFSADKKSNISNITIGSCLHYSLFKYLKKIEVAYIDMGIQVYEINDTVSAKDVNISFYKRGFGGSNYPFYQGTKLIRSAL